MKISYGDKHIGLFSHNTNDEILSKCLSYYWASSIANASFKRILGIGMTATLLSALISMPLFILFALKSVPVLHKKRRLKHTIIPILLFMASFIISYLRGTPLEPMPNLLMWGFLSFFLGNVVVSINNYETTYKEFVKRIPLFLILSVPVIIASRMSEEYLMHFSFMLVLPMCLCFYLIFEEKKRIYIFPLMVFFALVFLYGSRGALGCLLIFIVIYIIFKSKKLRTKVTLILVTVFGIAFYTDILMFLYNFLESRGFSSRTIWLMVNDPTHDSGRSKLFEQAQKLIEMKPWIGWGVAGERQFMEVYPHNIVYEFQIDFGRPLGYALLAFVLILMVFGFTRCKGKKALFYTVFVASAISLLWSGSYLSSPNFWIVLYMAIHSITKRDRDYSIEDLLGFEKLFI